MNETTSTRIERQKAPSASIKKLELKRETVVILKVRTGVKAGSIIPATGWRNHNETLLRA